MVATISFMKEELPSDLHLICNLLLFGKKCTFMLQKDYIERTIYSIGVIYEVQKTAFRSY